MDDNNTHEMATEVATEVADLITDIVRSDSGPITWLTGNAYMPPIRSYPQFETLWQLDDNGDAFESAVWTLEGLLEDRNIMLTCPDYDNALYGVDLSRWGYVGEDGASLDLGDDWAPIVSLDSVVES